MFLFRDVFMLRVVKKFHLLFEPVGIQNDSRTKEDESASGCVTQCFFIFFSKSSLLPAVV